MVYLSKIIEPRTWEAYALGFTTPGGRMPHIVFLLLKSLANSLILLFIQVTSFFRHSHYGLPHIILITESSKSLNRCHVQETSNSWNNLYEMTMCAHTAYWLDMHFNLLKLASVHIGTTWMWLSSSFNVNHRISSTESPKHSNRRSLAAGT